MKVRAGSRAWEPALESGSEPGCRPGSPNHQYQNWVDSVESTMATVEDLPPETALLTASK